MYIVKGANEDLRPVNVGLLFFSRKPEEFFPRSWIELVWHKDGSGQRFEEHYFKGPLHHQLRDAMSFIQTNIISEKVIKHGDRIEASRFYNFPLAAIEETLSNAVYHKSYERQSPIEVQVWADKIEILSFPGPVPPVNAKVLESERRIVSREYRNRRIGDFLKELELTEGRGTGFPAVYNAMEANGSPKPIFKTDESSSYFLSVIPAHPEADKSFLSTDIEQDKHVIFRNLEDIARFANGATNGVTNQVTNQVANEAGNDIEDILNREVHDRVREILTLLQNRSSRGKLFEKMGLTNQSFNREKFLDPLISLNWIEVEFPDKMTTPKQTYMITDSGKRVLALLK
jgi:ATP-dependent DNA helicase RecG